MPFLDPPPALHGQFFYPERGQKQTFLIPSPRHLVHVVIERPLNVVYQVQETAWNQGFYEVALESLDIRMYQSSYILKRLQKFENVCKVISLNVW